MKNISNLLKRWKKIAEKVGNFQSQLILTVFYFTFFAPFSIMKYFYNPLNLKWGKKRTNWTERNIQPDNLNQLKRQF